MDAISYAHSAKQEQRIKKFINDPDSTSGVLTVPKVIASGESVTIPAGRVAILPDVQVDGTLNVLGDIFIPTGTANSKVVQKVVSTDKAIPRFNGTTGDIQNSGVIIDDNNNVTQRASLYKRDTDNISVATIDAADGTSFSFNDYTGGGFKFNSSSISRMRIDSNGNVGIGTVPSAWGSGGWLEFVSTAGLTAKGGLNIGSNWYYNNGYKYTTSAGASNYFQQGGQHQWSTAPVGTAGNPITWTNAMTLDGNGSLNTNGSVSCGYTNGSYTSVGSSSIVAFGGAGNSYTQIVGRSTSDAAVAVNVQVAGVYKAGILANGNFQSATNSYGSTSDAKLKENIQDASPKLDKLMQVQVRTFNYIGQEDKQIGVVAQEIEKIFPSIVYETKDTKQVEVEKEREITLEDGTVDIEKYTEMETVETGEVTKNVKYSVIYMMMLKAMQEQNEIIKDLKSRIEILEAK